MAKQLEGPARKKVTSLAAALDEDNGDLIRLRWRALCSTLSGHASDYTGQIRALLNDEQAARLERMTSFKA